MIVLGTRPEVIKLAPLILALTNSNLKNRFIVVSTSQHEELLDEQLAFWNITPDYFLTPPSFNSNLVRLLAHTLSGLQDITDQIKTIDYVIVQGDTNTALACANLAFLNQLKLIHIEAGLRTFDLNNPFPEEFNRRIASKVAYFHFAPTTLSKANLIKEGIKPSRIKVIGNTVIDALHLVKEKSKEKYTGKKHIILITMHRRENLEVNYLLLIDIIYELAGRHPELKFVWVTHPNLIERIYQKMPALPNIVIHQHIPYDKFVNFYDSAKMIITDSGGVSEEAIQLGLPLIVFRLKTERIEAVDTNYPMIVSLNKKEILSFFSKNLRNKNTETRFYGKGNASINIINWLSHELESSIYENVIIGGGPAGTGLLLKALKDGPGNKFLESRTAVVEKSSFLVKGSITQYAVNSDTFSDVFLECLDGATSESINIKKLKHEIDKIKSFKGQSIPLKNLDIYYQKLGDLLKAYLESEKKCEFFMNSKVTKIMKLDNGTFRIFIEGQKDTLVSRRVIIATGGTPKNVSHDTLFSRTISLKKFSKKIIHSDALLKSGIPEDLSQELTNKSKVVILGGSHSAFSAAHLLLNSGTGLSLNAGDIEIWSKSLPKIYFPSSEDAISHGYTDFTADDICPVTKKLYRLAGLRMDGRDLYMKMSGLTHSQKEERVILKCYKDQIKEMEKSLKDATLIVLAFGYKLNIFPLLTETNNFIELQGEETNHWVNHKCEMLDTKGRVISGLYATGLATGFIPSGTLGGEPSFTGQTNGIWYYQNAIADQIISNLQ